MFTTCVTNKLITHKIVTDLPSVNVMLKTCTFPLKKNNTWTSNSTCYGIKSSILPSIQSSSDQIGYFIDKQAYIKTIILVPKLKQ